MHSTKLESLPALPEVMSTSCTSINQQPSGETDGNRHETMNPSNEPTERSKSAASLGGARSHQSLSAPSAAQGASPSQQLLVPSAKPSNAAAGTSLAAVNELSPELAAASAAAAALASLQHPFTLSPGELAAAFTCLSTDGQRVTRTDIRDFMDFYFPDMPDKLERMLLGGNNKEDREIGLVTLVKIMSKKKDMAVCTYQDVGKALASGLRVPLGEGVVMSQQAVKACVERITERAPIRVPTDLSAVMARLDADADGAVGVEDWKAVRCVCSLVGVAQ
ncbi:hypothetical protein BCR44DRAFT_29954, partial [Catenaria anguillulae PL171]